MFTNCENIRYKILMLLGICFGMLYLLYYTVSLNRSSNNYSNCVDTQITNPKSEESEKLRTTKYILYWTPMFGRADFYLGYGYDLFENCEFKNCFATSDKIVMPVENFDAIAFHHIEFSQRHVDLPAVRKQNQIYIYDITESPVSRPLELESFNSFYNWTMTYRRDSTVPRLYGYVIKKETDYKLPSVEFVKNKIHSVAWFASHCITINREREELVKELGKFIPVHVYGDCGNFSCPRNNEEYCYDMLEKNYKFYLALENTFCFEYVTEKLYKTLNKNIIPVVYGGADYAVFAPPHSVINVEDFDNVEALANYLKYLIDTPSEYLKYFNWKKNYTIDPTENRTVCYLCERLNAPLSLSVCDDLDRWWQDESLCRRGKFYTSLEP